MASVEEKVEEFYKAKLDSLKIRHYGKSEQVNRSIDDALKNADSKSGNSGKNYPDIKILLQNKTRRDIPVMVEAKGSKGKLEKLTKTGEIELVSNGKNPYSAVMNYAVNGALHYGNAILAEGTYTAADSSVVFSQEKLCKFKFFFSHSAPPGHSAEGVFQIILSSYDLRKN